MTRVLTLALLLASAPAAAQFTTLVRVGDPIPSTDIDFADLEAPVIGPDGAIAFVGLFEGARVSLDATEDEGLFVYQADGDTVRRFLVFREGEEFPMAGGPTTGIPRDFRIMGDGRLVVRADYQNADIGSGNIGIWTWGQGDAAPTPEVLRRDAIDGANFEWDVIQSLEAGPSGAGFSFESTIVDLDNLARRLDGFGARNAAGAVRVVMTNLPSDTDPDFSRFDMRTHHGNGVGVLAVAGRVSPVVDDNYDTVFVDGAPTVSDTDEGLDDFQVGGINDAGQVLVFGSAGTAPDLVRTVWLLEPGGDFTTILSPGDAIAVTGLDGATWDQASFTGTRMLLGGSGHVAAVAVHGDAQSIVLRDPDGSWRLVATEGATVGEYTFEDLLPDPNGIGTNAQGNVVFRATVSSSRTSGTDSLWGYDQSAGELVRLLVIGQELSVEGEPHRLTDFDVRLGSGGQDGDPTGYNDNGEIGLILRYEPIAGGSAITTGGCAMGNAPIDSAGAPGGGPGPGADMGPGGGSDGSVSRDGGTGSDSGDGGGGGCAVNGRAPMTTLALLGFAFWLVRRRR